MFGVIVPSLHGPSLSRNLLVSITFLFGSFFVNTLLGWVSDVVRRF
jgi:hypothetical protein